MLVVFVAVERKERKRKLKNWDERREGKCGMITGRWGR
jgi:hypothetical protein